MNNAMRAIREASNKKLKISGVIEQSLQNAYRKHLLEIEECFWQKTGRKDPEKNENLERITEKLGFFAANCLMDELNCFTASEEGLIEVIDFFSGCGGMSVGFSIMNRFGSFYRLLGGVDFDPSANATYRANLCVPAFDYDISELARDEQKLEKFLQKIDRHPDRPLVLIGCAPCQGFSSYNRKHGDKDDPRNGLVADFARIVERLKPDVAIMENVPELLKKKYMRHFNAYEEIVENSGYVTTSEISNLAGFGVPQARHRALILSAKRKISMPKPLLSPGKYVTVKEKIADLPTLKPGDVCKEDPDHAVVKHKRSTIETIEKVPLDGGSRPKGVGPKCLDKVKGFSDVYGRLYWDRPAITITAHSRNPASGRFVHPTQHRGLSAREAAMLQGFPKKYRFKGSLGDKFRQIGNAVPPIFSTQLAAFLLIHFIKNDEDEGQTHV